MNYVKKIVNFLRKQRKNILIALLGVTFSLLALTTITYFSVKGKVTSYTASEPITIYDKDENIVDYLSKQKGENADMKDIPVYLQKAFISVEDRRFYSHHGVDLWRLGKAVLVNLSRGRIAQGGSTISQQLAKNAFLSNERTFTRKFKELIITLEIERIYSKDEILEKYLNEIYFGSGSYGVREAAKDIFNKDISKVNLAESAMLAGIPNRPNMYNPRKNLEAAMKRTHLILKLMLNQNYISQDEYDAAVKHKFVMEADYKKTFFPDRNTTVIVKDGRRKRESTKAPDFMDIVEEKLIGLVEPSIFSRGGFKVYTTLDNEMQKIAKNTFENYSKFKGNKKLQGAMVTLDAKTGEVRSLVGGKGYRSGNFNRGVDAKRQIGSTFKPFIYYTALEKGYTMNQIIDGSNTKYGNWSPKNYGNAKYKNITLIQSLEKSVNTVAVKLLNDVGIDNVIDNFTRTGVDVEFTKDLTIALGSTSASPLELAASYLPFANGGTAHRSSFITRIEDTHGNIIYENEDLEGRNIYGSIDASLMTSMLEKVVEYGSGRGAKLHSKLGFNVDQGGKTGTSNDFRSAWYAGFTSDYVTVVYMGYDDNTSMPNRSSGGRMAVPLWKNYYQTMIDRGIYTPTSFDFIDKNIRSGELVRRNIDIRSGEVKRASREFRREVLFKKGQVPDTITEKIFKGIKGWFN
ncbi:MULTISPECIES: transglycosylase domain-containing protein [Psychrilyobacter]|uniref:peptidoglycan glycosyltransferase n=1 Tax=Psychrilyobacter piezotolerans TaxID=2293438 RepID=A0ABX9KGH4_9FUSO|nr:MULTISPECIES: PBP1A family penicillin-binding protein [Psychrilyobacter]MCS5420431.1 PBP1A family penicillin-binding protein [Psychrilyobacter sp. S5]NDI78210.1 PBP1A family penicillin-binding protein [Psychrilyobacter piezotolerans]RDE61227.1 PBP1A family penicillin-binding protein [Psychrilyobacter sp. S5]REI40895.1 PBP1A family penicillin-binding protein [Psychrilyobacter piezotolerans]